MIDQAEFENLIRGLRNPDPQTAWGWWDKRMTEVANMLEQMFDELQNLRVPDPQPSPVVCPVSVCPRWCKYYAECNEEAGSRVPTCAKRRPSHGSD